MLLYPDTKSGPFSTTATKLLEVRITAEAAMFGHELRPPAKAEEGEADKQNPKKKDK